MSLPPARNYTDGFPIFTRLAAANIHEVYSSINGNYMALATVCVIVLLSFLLPDISQKMHRTNELKNIKKVLQLISKEASKAEVACLTVADKITNLKLSMQDGATETVKDQQDLAVCTSASGTVHVIRSAPVHVEKKIGLFRRLFLPNKNTSHKEVTLMSYLYTDSFDDLNNKSTDEPRLS